MTAPHQRLPQDAEKKLHISIVAATTTPCDAAISRNLLVYISDEEKVTIPIKCVQLSDAGISVQAKPAKPGKYTLNLSYSFEIKESARVEAKMLILDGRFGTGEEAMVMKHNDDESWSTDGKGIAANTVSETVDTVKKVDEEVQEKVVPKASLAKHLHRLPTIVELVGETDITKAARRFSTLDEVTEIMRKAGLKSGNLIFGIDYTASNRTQGRQSFGGKSLHSIDYTRYNPYQQVISILGKTLEPLSDQGSIPAYGFGDVKASDHSVFAIQGPEGPCKTFMDVLRVYNTMTPTVTLSGPTNFGPIIREAINIYKNHPAYYVLVIAADGQVNNEPDTVEAIVGACSYPISIVVVGVGDGPWGMMNEFDERIPHREWDNFNFVDFNLVMDGEKVPEVAFAVHALSEVPDQYATIKRLGLLDTRLV